MEHAPVTVTVTNYNGAAYLPWCLDAVKQLTPRPAEIMVVDNASTDGSLKLLKERYPEVHLIALEKNEGPCPARNLALKRAAHPLVFQIDCDIAPDPSCLEILLRAMEAGGEAVAVCQPRCVFADQPDRIHYDGAWFHYAGVMNLINYYGSLPAEQEGLREVDAVISMALLLRRDRILEIGGYDPVFFILFEDHDLSYRLRSRDHKLLSVPEAVVFHREGTAGVSFREAGRYPTRRAFLHSRNRWIVMTKNHRVRTLLLTAPGLLLFELAWLVFSLREGFLLEILKGKLSFLRLLPRLLKARGKVQSGRCLGDRDLLGARDLTFSPLIKKSGLGSFLVRSLNALLRAWWRLVKPLVG